MLIPAIRRFLRRRRFPTLMLIGGLLFLANLVLPDPVPFIDEILLLIGTIAVGSLRDGKNGEEASGNAKPDAESSERDEG